VIGATFPGNRWIAESSPRIRNASLILALRRPGNLMCSGEEF
jgi:hypothetical protein